jgi:hypothetical protein
MVTYKRFAEELITQGIDKTIVEKLIEEYRIVKREHLLGDDEKAVLHSAKVSDLILALIKNKVSGQVEDVNNLHFSKLLEETLKYPKPSAADVILTLAIPRVAESVYTIRSKKDVAHVKTIDPSFIDSSYCVSACDWMLSELVLLFYKADVNEASELINSILTKKVPTIEEFEDGSVVILRKDLSLKQEFLLFLYHDYPKRTTNEDLIERLHYGNPKYAERILKELEGEKFVHRNNEGNKLTKNAIKYVEDEILTKKG